MIVPAGPRSERGKTSNISVTSRGADQAIYCRDTADVSTVSELTIRAIDPGKRPGKGRRTVFPLDRTDNEVAIFQFR